MPDLLSFEWARARDGYSVETLNPEEVDWAAGKTEDGSLKLKASATERTALLAFLLGARPIAQRKTQFLVPRGLLVPKGHSRVLYNPLDAHSALFREFVEIPCNAEGVQRFADRYGFLLQESASKVSSWYSEIRQLRTAVSLWERSRSGEGMVQVARAFNRHEFHGLSAALERPWNSDRVSLSIIPADLLSAIWLQFGQAVSSNTQLQRCLWCGTWFAYGTGTGRRKSAHYCSDRCRKASHRDQQKVT